MAKKGNNKVKDEQGNGTALSEYRDLKNLGFISMEEVDAEEAATILQGSSRNPLVNRSEKSKKKTKVTNRATEVVDNTHLSTTKITSNLTGWKEFSFPTPILQVLQEAEFFNPTEVQKTFLNQVILDKEMLTPNTVSKHKNKDILVSAPTGSGKTLAFLLPIVNRVLECGKQEQGHEEAPEPKYKQLAAIIIVPTRELALQIQRQIQEFSKHIPEFYSAILVGGLSQEKQERVLGYDPDIIVGTPGRLGEVMAFDERLKARLPSLKYLVLDEADRLVEAGHFKDLNAIISTIFDHSVHKQTFLFSATLNTGSRIKLTALRNKLKLQKPITIDIRATSSIVTKGYSSDAGFGGEINPMTLQHLRLRCLAEDKNIVLTSLLKTERIALSHGRILIFVNTISYIKDLTQLLQLLGFVAYPLHAQMQQRQRLKNLDRFTTQPGAILVTSDVAARGLDIPSIDVVIHYHIPRDLDTFLHRSGRTARAGKVGNSISLVSPSELCLFNRLTGQAQVSIKDHPLEEAEELYSFKHAVLTAQKIQKLESSNNKQLRQESWEKRTADVLGIELERDSSTRTGKRALFTDDNFDDGPSINKQLQFQIKKLKAELDSILTNFPNRR